MSCIYDRPVFLPDIVVQNDVSFTIDIGGTPVVISIGKGSWFANALVFWLFVCNNIGSDILYLFDDSRPTIVPSEVINIAAYSDAMNELIEQTGDMFDGQDCVIPRALTGFYPLVEYTRGLESLDGRSVRAQDGSAFTVSGLTQETRSLRRVLDRDGLAASTSERDDWLNLWRNYWRIGRSVSVYPFNDIVSEVSTDINWTGRTDSWGDDGAGRFDQLVIPFESSTVWRPSRLVEAAEKAYVENTANKFYIRQSVPMSDPQPQIKLFTSLSVV